MCRHVCAAAACVMLLGTAATGEVILWEGNPANVWWYDVNAVKILAPGTYKFEALTNGQLSDINHILVDASCPAGDIYVYVVRNPNEVGGQQHEPGASNLKEINLTGSAATGVISEVVITGDLGELGPHGLSQRAT